MKTYKPKKDWIIKLPILFCTLIPSVFIYSGKHLSKPFVLILLTMPLAIVLWIYFGTKYSIRNNKLFYRSAFIFGQIEIKDITEITVGIPAFVMIRPATSIKGLSIKYNKYDEVFVSPENTSIFISDLKEINENIVVKNA